MLKVGIASWLSGAEASDGPQHVIGMTWRDGYLCLSGIMGKLNELQSDNIAVLFVCLFFAVFFLTTGHFVCHKGGRFSSALWPNTACVAAISFQKIPNQIPFILPTVLHVFVSTERAVPVKKQNPPFLTRLFGSQRG